MATLRKRSNGHWQARVRKANQSITKTFINKVDAERWAKQVEVEMQKGSYTNLVLAERTTLGHDSDAKYESSLNRPPKQGANMIQNPEKYLTTAGGKIRCRRCKAQSSRTKLQCAKPALKGKTVCGHHGGYSTGPKTKAGKGRIRAAHLKHGEETLEAKAERSEKSVMFRYLTDIGNHCNMFYKELKTRGRPPSGYTQLNLSDPEQLALAIFKTLTR